MSTSARISPTAFAQRYAVAIALVIMIVVLSFASDAFLTVRNIANILNQNTPLAIMAAAMTFVIIGGGFDLSVGAIFGVASVVCASLALAVDPVIGLIVAPLVGLALGTFNGVVVTQLRVHSFLATLATGLVFGGLAILISDGNLIPVRIEAFTWLGRQQYFGINVAVVVLLLFSVALAFVLGRTGLGRRVYAVGGNEQAAQLSGIRVDRVRIATFAISGLAAGLASAITVSRISMGQATAGQGMELQAIAAVILGGTSIYGGEGAVWRSVAGVMLLALINNGFNILNADPFYKDLATGVVILLAVGVSVAGKRS
ncbi:MAG: ABC transporter permease [Rhizobiaceae bacterium]